MITDVFLDQKKVNVYEHMVKTAPRDSFGKVPPEWVRDGEREEGMEGCIVLQTGSPPPLPITSYSYMTTHIIGIT